MRTNDAPTDAPSGWIECRPSGRDASASEPLADDQRTGDGFFSLLSDVPDVLMGIVSTMSEAVFVKDLTGRYVLVNRPAVAIIGKPAEEILGRTTREVFPPEVATDLEAADVAVLETGKPARCEAKLPYGPTGELREFLFTKSTWHRASGDAAEGIVVHAVELHPGEVLFSEIVSLASDAIIIIDADRRILLFNRGAEGIFGYSASEVLGKPIDLLLPEHVREDHRVRHIPGFIDATISARNMGERMEVMGRRKHGELFPAEVAISRTTVGGAVRLSAILRDVSAQHEMNEERERQRLELARSNAELARSNAELEQFAYVASHDLQEPLRAVASHTQLLEERYGHELDDRALKHIHYAVEGAHRMQALIQDLLTLSRVGTHARPFAPVDLDVVAAEAVEALEAAEGYDPSAIHVSALPVVYGDAAQLGQVFLNLIGNALKFHRRGVTPDVRVRAEASAREWTITVRDNGIGIAPEFAERIFEVFRRLHTREEYPGTGIGLAICRKVVERHGGRIWVEPAPGAGSIFRFTLPRDERLESVPQVIR